MGTHHSLPQTKAPLAEELVPFVKDAPRFFKHTFSFKDKNRGHSPVRYQSDKSGDVSKYDGVSELFCLRRRATRRQRWTMTLH